MLKGIRYPLTSLFLLIALFLLFPSRLSAQIKYTIKGVIKDSVSGETLIRASVKILEQDKATSTNTYGFYSISTGAGDYTLQLSYIGYRTVLRKVSVQGNQNLSFELAPDKQLKEVVVSSRASNEQITRPQMGLDKLNMEGVKNIPVLLGERDILKTIQLLPGIKSAGEGNSGFYVRGGSSDQNLILLDEANVYNASHLLGFFSTFNSDAIKDVSVYKGGMPAQYGGRLASVVDITMNEGNRKEYTAEGGVGLIASRLKVEGPIKNGKGSFMLGGRRTYADLFLKLSSDTALSKTVLYFYDFNAKANYKLNENNTIYISGYFGKDQLGLNKSFYFNWGNSTATFRWNHLFSDKIFSNTSLIYSDYDYAIENLSEGSDFRVTSIIRDWNLKQDYQYFASSSHTLRFGINASHHKIRPGEISSSSSSDVNNKVITSRQGTEWAMYISDEWKPSNSLSLNYGLRASSFALFGPGTIKKYDGNGSTVSSKEYKKGEIATSYFYLEPRFAASLKLSGNSSVKASLTRNTQNLHLLSNSTASLPTDTWVMSSRNIKPEIADQVSVGYYKNFFKDNFEFSSELYYKKMENQIDYKNAANLRGNEDVESELLFGKGRAYGVELFLKKRYGKYNGWLGYTLSRTERSFDGIDEGNYFPAKQDRTHDVSLVNIYNLSKRWTLSATFVYNTGNAVTYPSGKYQLDGHTEYYYSERNGYRLPDYHRLDFGATLNGRSNKRYKSSWTFSVYNLYNRKNAYIVEFKDNPDDLKRTQAVQTSLFGIIPSVTWNFKY
ncbi:TonB-dependent receptor [Desertivirga arenae]|uniref:TonB-dependent receptor n=1 Tax=Desertivirga arenae TaxID=2810309 RepID=UPI001A96A189|nr:TonB-dependent receptor [Pedobacter sp. SYSU D00823]